MSDQNLDRKVRTVVILVTIGTIAWLIAGIVALVIGTDTKIIWTCVFGAVLGATLDLPALGIHPDEYPALPVLAPGFGFQGARVEDAQRLFGNLSTNLIVSETRSVLSAGREGVVESVTRRAGEVASALA